MPYTETDGHDLPPTASRARRPGTSAGKGKAKARVIEQLLLHNYAPATIGWTAVAAGAAGMASLVLALLASVFGRLPGRIGDGLEIIAAILSAGLAMLLFPQHRALEPQLAQVGFAAALLGGFAAAFGSVLSITEAVSWFRTQLYVAAGYGLLGVWLLILNISAGGALLFPSRVVNLGIFSGSVMALGITAFPGILGSAESESAAPWISRYVGRAGYLGWLILYPLWCIWLGESRLPF